MNQKVNQFTHIFNEALDLPKEERQAYVEKMSGSNAELQQRLLDLLDSAEEASAFFNDLQADMYDSLVTQDLLTGSELLNYKIGEKLGEGGMATVYKAQRADGLYEGEVAFKVFDKGKPHPELAQRFEYERKILASLSHPNIAQIIDAGATPEGVPFYLLEYVNGQNVLAYVQENQLSLQQTLELFLKIAKAVQYAHQNFIIHRDIKPANILVDKRGEPKLLDFGIAKVMENAALPSLDTQAFLLTPEYASPEQLVGKNITTATDVYLLGLLLYELITFAKPFTTKSKDLLAIHQERQKQGITPPLKRVRSQNISRDTTGISYDLDTIVNQMLTYEPEERYSSVQSLVEDIEALLANQPIKAKAQDWLYQTKKYVKRNPALVSLGGVLVASLLTFTLVYIVNINKALTKAEQATQEARRFQKESEKEAKVSKQVSGFLVDLFQSSHPDNARGKEVTAQQILEKGYKKIKKTKQSPEVKTRLLITMSTTFRAFHQNKKAEEVMSEALSLYTKEKNPNLILLASLYQEKGILSRDTEKTEEAIEYLTKATQTLEKLPQRSKEANELLSSLYGKLAYIYRQQNDLDKALTEAKKGLAIQQKIYPENHIGTAETLFIIAGIYKSKMDYKTAEQYQRQSLNMCKALFKGAHPGIAANLGSLAFFLEKQKKYKEAEKILQESLQQNQQLYGEKHRSIATAYNNLGNNTFAQKNYSEAITYYKKATAMSEGLFGRKSSGVAVYLHNQARVRFRQKQFKEAITLLKEASQINEDKKRKKNLAGNYILLARAYYDSEAYNNTIVNCKKALELYQSLKPSNTDALARTHYYIGQAQLKTAQYPQAAIHLNQAYELFKTLKQANNIKKSLELLVTVYEQLKEPQKQKEFQLLLSAAK
ncbi:hypothetical protein BKI52_02045 [marine bacterium AO1-C]|nr:hypothetical protein BKI52_02045 [marine bacterium AO1-C]